MGTYVYYSLGEGDGIRSRFLADASAFLEWFKPLADEFPNDYPAAQVTKASEIARLGVEALAVSACSEADLIDRVVDEYWNFCDMKGLYQERDITPSAHKWSRYAQSLSAVLPSSSAAANTFYRSLFRGRSLAECPGHLYQSEDEVFRLSWLLPHEVTAFHSELEPFELQLLDQNDDQAAGVLWVLQAVKRAVQEGTSLVVAVA